MGEYAGITQELRALMSYQALVGTDTFKSRVTADPDAFDAACDDIDAIHRSLEQENERLRDASERGDDWIKLPVDADWVPIRIGDMLAEDEANPERVKSLMLDCDGWNVNFGLGWCVSKYHKWHHAKPDTWESIIEDAIDTHGNGFNPCWTDERDKLVARCKALCERTREGEE